MLHPYRNRFRTIFPLLILGGVLILTSCTPIERRGIGRKGTRRFNPEDRVVTRRLPSSPYDSTSREVGTLDVDRIQVDLRRPWKLWDYGLDLEGSRIRSEQVLNGDQFFGEGNYVEALQNYEQSLEDRLTATEWEAVIYRLASTELVLKNINSARKTLAQYFSETGQSAEVVSYKFSLLFGYVFGMDGDVDQSLAWFSKAERLADTEEERVLVREGVKEMLRALPGDSFYRLGKDWAADRFVYEYVALESDRRVRGGAPERIGNLFSFAYTAGGEQLELPDLVYGEGLTKVGVLLPLSGRYGSLGESVRNGLQLAFDQSKSGVQLVFRDTQGEPDRSVTLAKEFMQENVSVILGPLLADPTRAVATVARRHRFPMLALTKSSQLVPGGPVMRLGPTVETQVRSLLREASEKLEVKKFAIVYPENSNGYEYLRVFKEELYNQGLRLAYEESYFKGDAGAFGPVGESLEEEGIEAVFLPDSLIVATRFLSSLSEGYRDKVKLFGTASWDNPTQIARSKRALEGIIYVSPFFSESPEEFIVQFRDTYRDRYNLEPNFLAAQGYDVGTMVLGTITLQNQKEKPFVSAVRELQYYEGLTGGIQITDSGEMDRRFAVVRLDRRGPARIEEPETPVYILHGDDEYQELE